MILLSRTFVQLVTGLAIQLTLGQLKRLSANISPHFYPALKNIFFATY